ncbi:MAG: hypothetical protein RMK02_11035 [Burkholderiales bacterium]|nr:hypothetical protein [Burkholderiales bacterium]
MTDICAHERSGKTTVAAMDAQALSPYDQAHWLRRRRSGLTKDVNITRVSRRSTIWRFLFATAIIAIAAKPLPAMGGSVQPFGRVFKHQPFEVEISWDAPARCLNESSPRIADVRSASGELRVVLSHLLPAFHDTPTIINPGPNCGSTTRYRLALPDCRGEAIPYAWCSPKRPNRVAVPCSGRP